MAHPRLCGGDIPLAGVVAFVVFTFFLAIFSLAFMAGDSRLQSKSSGFS